MLTNETITKEEYGRDNKDILEHKQPHIINVWHQKYSLEQYG